MPLRISMSVQNPEVPIPKPGGTLPPGFRAAGSGFRRLFFAELTVDELGERLDGLVRVVIS